MLQEPQTARIGNQGVPGYTGLAVVCPAKTAIDDDSPAPRLHRALAFPDLDRDMAVDDMSTLRVQTEFLQDTLAACHGIDITIVRVRGLLPGTLIGHQGALKRLEFTS